MAGVRVSKIAHFWLYNFLKLNRWGAFWGGHLTIPYLFMHLFWGDQTAGTGQGHFLLPVTVFRKQKPGTLKRKHRVWGLKMDAAYFSGAKS